jgi:methionyl-tRNA synthetase
MPEIALILILLWSLPWKGVALWKAAKNNQPAWFVALIIINTVGILEITYLYFFQQNKNV